MHLFFVAWLSLLFAALTAAAPEDWTNAQRLARSLPPSRPKLGRILPGYVRSPVTSGAKRSAPPSASPRPSPSKKYEGRIQVVSYDGEPLGYLRNWATGSVSGVNYGGPSSELHVSLTVPSSGKGLVNILATNPSFPAPYYIGTTTSATLAPGSPSAVGFGNVENTPPLSPPVPYANQSDESDIWTFDPNTKQLKAHYINPDGSSANTAIVYNIWNNSIFFVGDVDAYNKAVTDPDYLVSPVTFYLADLG
ncbi:hypothetical protein PAXRUDRAFT_31354 [Paxillus rubicundulus Ve08.2h10]|uniref:Uncharacterized protein n=1 Tax=Paxillus rubicundulus Ve08.2h10 TaxID=930991 RepID=A0A0D0E2F3_9AGAM|nr:hypothetical protein PAXRUDRAFT_31354 [Paxillus rubicundulus Ve08.2h10]